MKAILLFIFISLPCLAFSQTQDSIYQYCQVKIIGRLASHKISIEVDYGQEQKFFNQSSAVKGEDGNPRTFNSVAHALNYMGNLGWKVVQAYMTGSDPSLSDYYFLMETRKKLTE